MDFFNRLDSFFDAYYEPLALGSRDSGTGAPHRGLDRGPATGGPLACAPSKSGGHRYMLDYVQEEILARLPTTLQDFVLSISILQRMSVSLCQAVTEEVASQEMLETIERANLFLMPLDDEWRWYRFHDIFREALLVRLLASKPERVPLLHQRAAHWYEKQGEF